MSGVETFFVILFSILIVLTLIAAYKYVSSAGNGQNTSSRKIIVPDVKTDDGHIVLEIYIHDSCNTTTYDDD